MTYLWNSFCEQHHFSHGSQPPHLHQAPVSHPLSHWNKTNLSDEITKSNLLHWAVRKQDRVRYIYTTGSNLAVIGLTGHNINCYLFVARKCLYSIGWQLGVAAIVSFAIRIVSTVSSHKLSSLKFTPLGNEMHAYYLMQNCSKHKSKMSLIFFSHFNVFFYLILKILYY